jgi:hypothetical protein
LSADGKQRRSVSIGGAHATPDQNERGGNPKANARAPCHGTDYSRSYEKTVNRAVSLTLALALLGASPAPLVAGSVRDQHGVPIAGAVVAAQSTTGRVQTQTNADGTFVLEGDGITSVAIRCRYCSPSRAVVASDGTVTAIVHRYDALVNRGPSADDTASLPYARIESVAALTPFTVLENSRTVLPGPQISSKVIDPGGGLLVDGGIPSYDITSGISPYLTIPYAYASSVAVTGPGTNQGYGDRADGGTVFVQSPTAGSDALANFGSSDAVRAALGGNTQSVSAGYSYDSQDRRLRADADMGNELPGGSSWDVHLTTQGNPLTVEDGDSIASGFSGARASYRLDRPEQLSVDAVLDRGSYDYADPALGIGAAWTDAGLSAGLSPQSGNGIFATVSARSSSGFYASNVLPKVAAHLDSESASAGEEVQTPSLDITAGISAYRIAYSGGDYGENYPASTTFAAPQVRAVIAPPGSVVSITLSSSEGYDAPTLLERYAFPEATNDTGLDRNETDEAEFTYGDDARVTASLFALTRKTVGLTDGFANSLGTSVGWQVGPRVSLRAWWMHGGIGQTFLHPVLQIGAPPHPSDVGAAWLSYELPGGLRTDVIWRRDLIDWQPDEHVDASVSGPLQKGLRWFAGTERWLFARSIEAGLRFER